MESREGVSLDFYFGGGRKLDGGCNDVCGCEWWYARIRDPDIEAARRMRELGR